MAERMFGLETEYGFHVTRRDPGAGDGFERTAALQTLLHHARKALPCVPGRASQGLFLASGARFYVDCGHPEWATAECLEPGDLVRQMIAGEQALLSLAAEVKRRATWIDEIHFWKANVDHGGTHAAFGSHESYAHRCDPAVVARAIIPHLVSRIIYTGAGGFNNLSPGLEWLRSPRVAHLGHVVSQHSTGNRAIVHTKDETLSGPGHHRLHLICGDSLSGQTGLWLRFATTALVVALAEAGREPAKRVALEDPLGAMQALARDPGCSVSVATADGRRLTALEIQRHYLAEAEAHVEEESMPMWAEEACKRWRAALDLLEADAAGAGAARTFDWAIKRMVYGARLERAGWSWERVERWSQALGQAAADGSCPDPHLRALGLEARDLPGFHALRQQMLEIDVRFSRLGEQGIFSSLDRAGVLRHRVLEDDPAGPAAPPGPAPPAGRARLRGDAIRALAGRPGVSAEWQGVYDERGKRKQFLDLGDPYANRAEWKELGRPESQEESLQEPLRALRALLAALGEEW